MKICRKRKPCVRCGTVTANRKYCSIGCQHLHIWEELKKDAIEKGRFPTWKNAKRWLLEINGITCDVCGHSRWMGKPMPITIDHINGNHTDHRIDNVRLICPNCDAQTDTYKGKNRGNGRHSRMERYNKGLSY